MSMAAKSSPTDVRVKVLIIDDSAVVRQLLTRELSRNASIHVVGTAADPFVARDKIVALSPDVLTLDIEMPRMNGLEFLRQLMTHHRLPVIVFSSRVGPGQQTAVEALAAGAADVLGKPKAAEGFAEVSAALVEKILLAARTTMRSPADASQTSSAGAAVLLTANNKEHR